MDAAIDSTLHLDHVGFIVADLATANGLMARLGFSQTARANHTRTDAQGAVVSAGSAQHAIMLHHGYIELMQITDASKGHQLANAPSVRFGLHILAFGTDDASVCHAVCAGRGVDVGPLLRWARPVQEMGTQGMAQFAYFGSAWTPHDASYLCWVQHLTPALMRPPHLLRHANSALALKGVCYRGPRLASLAWCEQLVAAGAKRVDLRPHGMLGSEDGTLYLTLPNARLTIYIDDAQPTLAPSALEMEFAHCDVLRDTCREAGLATVELGGGAILIDLTETLGLHWLCRPTPNLMQPGN